MTRLFRWLFRRRTIEAEVLGNFYVEAERLVCRIEPFRFYNPDNLLLTESIKDIGQRNPVIVWPLPDGRFGFVGGTRRVDVCKALKIPVLCVLGRPPENDAEAMKLYLDSNRTNYRVSNVDKASRSAGSGDQSKPMVS